LHLGRKSKKKAEDFGGEKIPGGGLEILWPVVGGTLTEDAINRGKQSLRKYVGN